MPVYGFLYKRVQLNFRLTKVSFFAFTSIGRLTYYHATQCQPQRAKTDARVEDRLAQLMCNLPQVPVRVMVWNDFTTDEKYKLLGARLEIFFV